MQGYQTGDASGFRGGPTGTPGPPGPQPGPSVQPQPGFAAPPHPHPHAHPYGPPPLHYQHPIPPMQVGPSFPAVAEGIDRVARRVPWWMWLGGGLVIAWVVVPYVTKRTK